MKQLRAFDQSKGGNKAGMCLQNVRLGFGISAKYPDAWTAWANTQQHKDRSIPSGIDVPLYYSYTATISGVRKNYGHINVRLANGTIWNDGRIFANLAAFEKAWSNVKYVGWGESINDVKVIDITPQGGASVILTEEAVKTLYRKLFGREGDAGGVKNYTGKTLDFALNDMINSQEFKNRHVKTVEKIVEKPGKEVIKQVPVGEEEAVRGFFDKLLDTVFKKKG